MAKTKIIINNFTGGVWSPLMDARADIGKYYNACRTLENCLVYAQGGAFKRPGTQYVYEVPDSDNITRLIPFQYSDSDAYILEFSDLLIRFYRTVSGTPGIILDDDGSTVTSIVSPYSSSDLALLQYAQSGDVLYLTHPSYKPRRLVRTGHNRWAISAPDFERGPFLAENDTDTTIKVLGYEIDTVTSGAGGTFVIKNDGDLSDFIRSGDKFTIHGSDDNDGEWTVNDIAYSAPDFTITVVASETVTADASHTGKIWPDLRAGHKVQLQASDTIWESTHVGALWELTFAKDADPVSGTWTTTNTGTSSTAAVAYGQKVDFFTHGTWNGTVSLEVSYDGGTTYETVYQAAYVNDGNIEIHEENDVDDALYRVNCSAHTSGTIKYNLVARRYKAHGVVEIDTVDSSTRADGLIKVEIVRADVPTTLWAEGAWSDYRGWPVAATFFEQRLIFGDNTYQPITIWGSKALPGGDYHNFAAGVNDDDAIIFTMAEAQQDPIKWLSTDKRLVVGTSGGTYILGASSSTEPMTPTNISHPEQQGIQGSAAIPSIKTSLGHLFIERGGLRVYELAYNWESERLASIDLTRLAEHITGTGISEIALQRRPEPVLWAVTDDGDAISLVYLREEDIVCWSKHTTTGSFESVAVIPGNTEDEVWFVVNRTINSATKRYVERLNLWSTVDGSGDQEDAFLVDCGLTYDGAPTTTITGLDHLEGETVSILADGGAHADKTVSGGEITLDRSASVVQVGLGYTATIKPMKIPKGELVFGSVKRVISIGANFYNTGYATFGSTAANMEEIVFREGSDSADTAVPLYNDVKILPFPGGYEKDGTVIIESDKPLPMTVLSISALVEIA